MKKTIIASDGSGFALKEAVKRNLIEAGYDVADVGTVDADAPLTHIQAARNLAAAMRAGGCVKAVIICGTGAGASMCMNKLRGMYCVACESMFSAPKIALINNANVLAMGARILGPENASEMALAFLEQGFADGFAPQRRNTVETLYRSMLELEDENLK